MCFITRLIHTNSNWKPQKANYCWVCVYFISGLRNSNFPLSQQPCNILWETFTYNNFTFIAQNCFFYVLLEKGSKQQLEPIGKFWPWQFLVPHSRCEKHSSSLLQFPSCIPHWLPFSDEQHSKVSAMVFPIQLHPIKCSIKIAGLK